MNGRSICKELKSIRKHIAEDNHIPLQAQECTYSGPCRGTCPHCEAEMQYLERELKHRCSMGKTATVAGFAIALSTVSVSCRDAVPPISPVRVSQSSDSVVVPTDECADTQGSSLPIRIHAGTGVIVDVEPSDSATLQVQGMVGKEVIEMIEGKVSIEPSVVVKTFPHDTSNERIILQR